MLHSPLPTPLDSGLRRNGMGYRIGEGMPRMANERLPERSIFIAMTSWVAGFAGPARAAQEDENGTAPNAGELAAALGGGQAPALHSPLSTPRFRPRIGDMLSADESRGREPTRGCWSSHPGSESRTAFVPIAHAGWCRHTRGKSRSCGLVQRIGTADSATPHPDPSGGQAPRLAKSSTALHFLIPPTAISLQFGTFRRWRAGIEVDWRAHPGSESGTCFRTNDEWRGRNDENAEWRGSTARSKAHLQRIFIAMTSWVAGITGAGCSLALDQYP